MAVGGEHARGRGPVLLVGGFNTTEAMLQPLRHGIEELGHRVLTHTLNGGMGCGGASVEAVRETLQRAREMDEYDDGVRLVGYSRGGQFTRAVAGDAGVHSLITLGTPGRMLGVGWPLMLPIAAVAVAGSVGVPNLFSLGCLLGTCCVAFRGALAAPVPVPHTAIRSRQDRLVPWRSSSAPGARDVEVTGSHIDLITAEGPRRAVAAALARGSVRLAG